MFDEWGAVLLRGACEPEDLLECRPAVQSVPKIKAAV